MTREFWHELRRRNVVRMALLYGVAAWLVLQVADVLFELLALPEWSLRLVFAMLLLGFPIALIVSWVFELTPEGIKRDEHVDRSDPGYRTSQKLNYAIIGVLSAAVVLLVAERWWNPGPETVIPEVAEEVPAVGEQGVPSIAVLPFVNMSADPDNEYFSDGLSETLTHMLAQLSSLRVAARTSAFQFKGKTVTVEEIGAALNVNTVLEGSVRKAGDTLRVTAQLVNVADGFHLWSATYDRQLDNVFVIQDEIARQVVDALKPRLLEEEVERMVARPTESIDAYNAYLLGREQLNINSYESLPRAEQFFAQALKYDPDYGMACAAQAETYGAMFRTGMFGKDDYLARAAPLAERAVAANPELGEIYPVRAEMALLRNDAAEAEALFKKGIQLSPSYAPGYAAYGTLLARQGRDGEARELVTRGLAIDPLSVPLHSALAELAQKEGDYAQVHAQFARIRELEPGNPNGYSGAGLVHWRLGEHDQAIRWLERSLAIDAEDYELPGYLALMYLDLGMLDVAERWIEAAETLGPDRALPVTARVAWLFRSGQRAEAANVAREALEAGIAPRNMSHGVWAKVLFAENRDAAGAAELLELFAKTLNGFAKVVAAEPDVNVNTIGWVGTAVVLLRDAGRGAQAEALLEAAAEVRPRLGRRLIEESYFTLLEVDALAGNRDGALEEFEALVAGGFWNFWYLIFEANPSLAPIVAEPRYQAGLDRIRSEAARLAAVTRESRQLARAPD